MKRVKKKVEKASLSASDIQFDIESLGVTVYKCPGRVTGK